MRVIALAGCLALAATLAAAESRPRTLTFEQRVQAQMAIERVYYARQIGASRAFEEAVPHAVPEEKVRKSPTSLFPPDPSFIFEIGQSERS